MHNGSDCQGHTAGLFESTIIIVYALQVVIDDGAGTKLF